MTEALTCDLVVIGSGAAGLSTAVTAAHLGLDVIVLEKDNQIGGTSAWSGGWLWVPRNPLAVSAGIKEDISLPLTYLKTELGSGFDEKLATRFLTEAPKMIRFMQENTALEFVDGNAIPDFHSASEGGAVGGRSICAAPFDGRKLKQRIHDLKPPLHLIAPFGMGIAAGADLRHFFNAWQKLSSFWHVAKRIMRHGLDKLLYGRGMRLVAGNALIARLLYSADAAGVRILTATSAEKILRDKENTISGVLTSFGQTVFAKRGVVLASGGFPHDTKRKAELFPHTPDGTGHYSAAPRSNTGDGLRLGEETGGKVSTDFPHAGAWAPVSLVPEKDGSTSHFPHLVERAKPGLIMVQKNGKRFCNEADSYHDIMQALFKATPEGDSAECWMICDHVFQRRYGLGRARPRPFSLRHWLKNSYLLRGKTIPELASACGIEAVQLETTLAQVNRDAFMGEDSAFHRGSSPYNRIQGEPDQHPNPCVRVIGPGPFYAVRIVPGSLGTFAGLNTNLNAQVLNAQGKPINGLYAVGNDMASMMRGRYPAGGITLGPAMTFGYIAAHHAAGIPLENNRIP